MTALRSILATSFAAFAVLAPATLTAQGTTGGAPATPAQVPGAVPVNALNFARAESDM